MYVALFLAVLAAHVLPFTMDPSGGIQARVLVDGRPYTFLVDTGSSRTVVSSTVQQASRAPLVAKTEVVTAAGTAWRGVARINTLRAGSASADHLLAMVLPEAELRAAAGPIDGILGQDFLAAQAYEIDYRSRTITFQPLERSGGVELPLVPSDGRYLLSLAQERGQTLRMVPDTGSDAVVLFGNAPLLTRAGGNRVRLAALTGSTGAESVTIPWLRLGSAALRSVPAVRVHRDRGDTHGLLPLSMFSRVLVDAPNARLVVWQR